jgi:hypothetical protein
VEGSSQAVLGSSDQRKVLASLSFPKSEKIPAMLYVGKRTCTQAPLSLCSSFLSRFVRCFG